MAGKKRKLSPEEEMDLRIDKVLTEFPELEPQSEYPRGIRERTCFQCVHRMATDPRRFCIEPTKREGRCDNCLYTKGGNAANHSCRPLLHTKAMVEAIDELSLACLGFDSSDRAGDNAIKTRREVSAHDNKAHTPGNGSRSIPVENEIESRENRKVDIMEEVLNCFREQAELQRETNRLLQQIVDKK
ncbi:hypothetical protein N0V93_010288 [Gnomoniopsis smithogilvyi]|uniref:Uncharacterized protein n=1 Tax=Gnomoniopsis smithogilvyi TaxID=1191159 RepID=A0A9W8YIN7_9PEZI|nr:hypothetical protein N0V93_010288 [Gnomoniopsis smithogilvyi]